MSRLLNKFLFSTIKKAAIGVSGEMGMGFNLYEL